MVKPVPGSREEDSWFSEEQLTKLALADEMGDAQGGTPIPTQIVSNGECTRSSLHAGKNSLGDPERPAQDVCQLAQAGRQRLHGGGEAARALDNSHGRARLWAPEHERIQDRDHRSAGSQPWRDGQPSRKTGRRGVTT